MDYSCPPDVLRRIGRAVFVNVDLDALVHNMKLLTNMCENKQTVRVAVVKGNAYGHGAIPASRYLMESGAIDRLAVATVMEAIQLRRAGVGGAIHVLGNVQSWEMPQCVRYRLIPTVASEKSIRGMASCLRSLGHGDLELNDPSDVNRTKLNRSTTVRPGTIHIKIDTGMARNGCQPQDLPRLVQVCKECGVPLEGMFSLLCNYEDPIYSQKQLDVFSKCTEPYRNDGYLFHIANSGAIVSHIATEMDMIRPGISLYGYPPGSELNSFVEIGFRPALALKGTPTLVKLCPAGTKVGYGCLYTCREDEWIGTFPLGYADGFWREMGEEKTYIVRDKTGEKCTVIGRVSMDAITVRLPCKPEPYELFTLISADFDPITSVSGIARRLGTIEHEVLIRLSTRLPRIYSTSFNKYYCIVGAFELEQKDYVTEEDHDVTHSNGFTANGTVNGIADLGSSVHGANVSNGVVC